MLIARTYTGRLVQFALLCAFAVGLPASSWAEYKISPGDVLGLTVIGLPDLSARAPVGVDGSVSLPVIGELPVAGLSVADATARVQAILPGKTINQRLNDGRTVPVLISPSEISLSVVEYRPVYISGDVAKPGELPYRPGLTVRQAVALAGGFDLVRYKLDNPLMQISELTGEYKSLSASYAKQQALVARLQAELDGKQDLDATAISHVPGAEAISNQIISNEQRQLAARNADTVKERAYLTSATQKESQRAQLLDQQESKELEGLKLDTESLQRYEDLFKKGAVALPGISEARRTVLASSTRALQTTAALASVQREEDDLGRRLERLDDARHMQLLHDIQDGIVLMASLRAQLQVVNTKLRYVGASKTQIIRGFDEQISVTLTRSDNRKNVQMSVHADEQLEPGDVVEVVVNSADELSADQAKSP